MPAIPPKSIMRSLGEFFGHIVHGARKPIDPRREVRREVEEQTRRIDGGSVVLRRTTIEEVEVKRDDRGAA